jgi:hypothetical protein
VRLGGYYNKLNLKYMTELLNIDHDVKPNKGELATAGKTIGVINNKITSIKCQHAMSDKEFNNVHDLIMRGLYFVADLSNPAFGVKDLIENEYHKVYKSTPELAKKLWLKHYHEIHQPYNILKNKYYNLFDVLEELYVKLNNKKPPQLEKISY